MNGEEIQAPDYEPDPLDILTEAWVKLISAHVKLAQEWAGRWLA